MGVQKHELEINTPLLSGHHIQLARFLSYWWRCWEGKHPVRQGGDQRLSCASMFCAVTKMARSLSVLHEDQLTFFKAWMMPFQLDAVGSLCMCTWTGEFTRLLVCIHGSRRIEKLQKTMIMHDFYSSPSPTVFTIGCNLTWKNEGLFCYRVRYNCLHAVRTTWRFIILFIN